MLVAYRLDRDTYGHITATHSADTNSFDRALGFPAGVARDLDHARLDLLFGTGWIIVSQWVRSTRYSRRDLSAVRSLCANARLDPGHARVADAAVAETLSENFLLPSGGRCFCLAVCHDPPDPPRFRSRAPIVLDSRFSRPESGEVAVFRIHGTVYHVSNGRHSPTDAPPDRQSLVAKNSCLELRGLRRRLDSFLESWGRYSINVVAVALVGVWGDGDRGVDYSFNSSPFDADSIVNDSLFFRILVGFICLGGISFHLFQLNRSAGTVS